VAPGNYLVLGFTLLAIVLGLRRWHRVAYWVGLTCVLASFGAIALEALLYRPGHPTSLAVQLIRLAGLLLTPLGWGLVLYSVIDWKIGGPAYLLPGLALAVILVLGSRGMQPVFAALVVIFCWPNVLARILGAFGLPYG
jgi:hypothetical protein